MPALDQTSRCVPVLGALLTATVLSATVLSATVLSCTPAPADQPSWADAPESDTSADASAGVDDGAPPADILVDSAADGDDWGDIGPPGEVSVTLVGMEGLEAYPDTLCAAPVRVLVHATDLGPRLLRLALADDAGIVVLDVPPTPHATELAIWQFDVDLSSLVGPELPLQDAAEVTLIAAAFEVDPSTDEASLPTGTAVDERTMTVDAAPPEIVLSDPVLSGALPTLAGVVHFTGTAHDATGGGLVEIVLDAEQLAEGTLSGATAPIELVVDLRSTAGRDGQLTVTATDACGLSESQVVPVRVVGWPWLRTFDVTPTIPSEDTEQIYDTAVADLNGDGFDDILIAGSRGVWVAANGGEAAPGQLDFIKLAGGPAFAISAINLDGDDELDVAVVDSDKGVDRLALYRQFEGNLYFVESRPLMGDDAITDLAGNFINGGDFAAVLDTTVLADPAVRAQGLIETVLDLSLSHGTENSLVAKLDGALEKLDDGNPNNDHAALGKLDAFINQVEAQRGKKISEDDADTLIAEASLIIQLLEDDLL